MGKPTGFLEFKRDKGVGRQPLERIKDYGEFHIPLSDQELSNQGARCMDCGVPFCHRSTVIAGAASGCPVNNNIPEWNDLVYKNNWKAAYFNLISTNPFPEFTGRVCPAPCEGSCVLSINEPAVSIKNIEQAIIDRAFSEGWVNIPAGRTSGKSVAVIGSGPAGLACADELCRRGHTVTVYERHDRPGGLLMYGIPNMKLDKKVVQRRIALLQDAGVKFKTSMEVGKDITGREIKKLFNAVVMCIGATQARDLSVAGRSLKGVHFAMEYLHGVTKSLLDSELKDEKFISAKDKDVVVIGGGDTGTDCVATALRQGCKSLVQFEITPKPPAERAADNPWPQWPKIYRLEYGQIESQAVFGKDPRKYEVFTESFIGRDGLLTEIRTPGGSWPAQLALISVGFLGPEQKLPKELGLLPIKADEVSYQTNDAQIFCAGDARRGQSLIVWAIREGKAAAISVDRYLNP